MKSVASLLEQWDGESIVLHLDRPTGAWIIIAIHSTRLGPASGGTRMKPYASLEDAVQDALNLGAGMSYKFASIGFPCGGGKAVIALPANFDAQARPALLRRYGALVKQLGGLFQTGPDVGTTSEDMDIISETGAPHVFARTPKAGGAGDSGAPTAVGVFQAIKTVCAQLFGSCARPEQPYCLAMWTRRPSGVSAMSSTCRLCLLIRCMRRSATSSRPARWVAC